MQIVAYVQAHFNDLVAIAGAIVLSARLIVKLTPTPADDTVLDKVITFLTNLGLHIPPATTPVTTVTVSEPEKR